MKKLTTAPLLVIALLAGCAKPSGPARAETGPAQNPSAPVAKVDGKVITDGELMAEAKAQLAAADARYAEEVWGVKSRTLDALIDKALLEARAKKEGITVDALLQREVTSKVPEPAEAYLRSIYEQAKAGGRQLPPFPEVQAEIAAFVKGQNVQNIRQAYVARLRAESPVEVLLPPLLLPKVDVKAEGPTRGDQKAPITVVEFSDYECPYCGTVEPTIKRILEQYPGKVRLVLMQYPLSIHPFAPKASEAALCAGEQGRYWEMHDKLFANQKALGVDALKGYARALALDPAAFDKCLDSGRMSAVINANMKAGEAAGVNSTPYFLVNGRPLSGAQPFERFKALIDWELAAAKR
ncbi:MAG TPA: thioredoxin domain-containing protein [Thermoanaerobaculia bacterium]|nr:thioredoxin domain-containing protein [Thermoanaerobaculia bacterium]HQR67362.1 thioredoxin domain-containing protein [Thermoanaerobaculia bacterium]